MSLELLFLLAVFVLLPLIQQLLENARQRVPRTPEQAERPPLRKPQTPAPAPLPPTLAIPPPLEMAPDAAAEVMTTRGRASAQEAAGPLTLAPTPLRSRRRRPAANLRNRPDLRGAIVLMAILGPCRAVNPYD